MSPPITKREPNHKMPTMLVTMRAMAIAVRPARASSRERAAANARSTAAAKRRETVAS